MKKKLSLVLVLICLLLTGCGTAEVTDGVYLAQVSLSGGSGRASVASPAQVTVTQGSAMATIVWSSSSYEYMLVDGQRYEPVTLEGGATFCIPVRFDEDLSVSASTVAMSQPHLIDYTLRISSSGLKKAEGVTP